MMKPIADLHCHSISSGHAYSTITEMAKAASEKGIKIIAITDHGPTMPGGPHLYHFGNLKALPKFIHGVRILNGVEANIIDYNGTLDMPQRYIEMLDIVLVGLHTYCYPGGSIDENTTAVINAMKNPGVDIVVHPGNPEFPVDFEKVSKAAIEKNVFLEINNSSFTISRKGSETNCRELAAIVKRVGGKLSFGSDSHYHGNIGNFEKCLEVAADTGIEPEMILNYWEEDIKAHLLKKNRTWA